MPRNASAGRASLRLGGVSCLFAFLLCLLAGCGGTLPATVSPGSAPTSSIPLPAPPAGAPAVLRVPEAYSTIQQAVDASLPGQIISIAPGVYHESVRVGRAHAGITIRGRDRNQVILEGDNRLPNGIEIEANQVVVENLTARHYVGNGFYWDGGDEVNHPLIGYRGSYLTAYANGDYGIYASNAQDGQFDHSYAAGNPNSGFYIGQCYPCNALIDQGVSEWNGLGYSGTNAGGNLILRDSVWRDNLAGIVPNSLDVELRPPEHQTIILNNDVSQNNNAQAPAEAAEYPLIGTGISLAGGVGNVIYHNQIRDQHAFGILVLSSSDAHFWVPSDNRIIGNTITNSGVADLALAAPSGQGNCFSQNAVTSTLPALLQQQYACNALQVPFQGGDTAITALLLTRDLYARASFHPASFPDPSIPLPPVQPQMPNVDGPAQPIFTALSLFKVPQAARALSVPAAALAPFPGSAEAVLQVALGIGTEWLPVALYAAWLAAACWNLARNPQRSSSAQVVWMAGIVALPLVGLLVFSLFGRSHARPQYPSARHP
ncbi:MAG TPA: right-handed parallel beta-helix repeat-containing protein [Ktedonobacterales bacterium]|nr:right-handed parallel beta-helix repeat-containing protein [Ktedonobacterales bacterium]